MLGFGDDIFVNEQFFTVDGAIHEFSAMKISPMMTVIDCIVEYFLAAQSTARVWSSVSVLRVMAPNRESRPFLLDNETPSRLHSTILLLSDPNRKCLIVYTCL